MNTFPAFPFIDLAAQQLRLGDRVGKAISQVLQHGKFIMGPEVGELENALALSCGVRHVVTCSSGTDALLMVLMAWGVRSGDAVFIPAFTFAATAEAVALAGATPVFVDVDPHTFNLAPDSLESAVRVVDEHGLRSAAVMPVDLFGQPADYNAISQVANGAQVLVDAAQSFGAMSGGCRVGALGDAAATSFSPAKPLGCYGDGGAVFTDNDATAELLRSIRVHGQGFHKYENQRIGLNARLDTIQAAILLEKLAIFDDELAARQAVADRYCDGLADVVQVPWLAPSVTSTWAQYTIVVDRRDEMSAALRDAGIPTAVYYPRPLHQQAAYRFFPVAPAGLAISESLSQGVLSLPMHAYLSPHQQDRVINAVRSALR